MLLRALRKQAGRPSPVLAVKLRGGTTVVRDLSLIRTRIRRMTAGQAGLINPTDLQTFNSVPAIARGKQAVEKSRSWVPDQWRVGLVQGPWHVLTPEGLSILTTCGNLCGLAAAASSDYITVRALSVGASTAVATFNFMMPKPLKLHQWAAGSWGTVFALLHLVNLTVLLYAQCVKPFTEEEEKIYQNGFHRFGVTPRQFTAFMAGAHYKDFGPGEVVAKAGTPVDKVFYVVHGSCEARHPETGTLRIDYHDNVFIGCLEPRAWQAEYRKSEPTDEFDIQDTDDHLIYGRRNIRAMLASGLEEKTGPRTRMLAGESWKNDNIAGPEGCRMLYWPLLQFADAVGKDYLLVRSMERVDEVGLACKMCWGCWGASHMALEGYKELIEAVSSEGVMIRPVDKSALARYRSRFGVPEAEHLRILKERGWNPQEFENGFKRRAV